MLVQASKSTNTESKTESEARQKSINRKSKKTDKTEMEWVEGNWAIRYKKPGW